VPIEQLYKSNFNDRDPAQHRLPHLVGSLSIRMSFLLATLDTNFLRRKKKEIFLYKSRVSRKKKTLSAYSGP